MGCIYLIENTLDGKRYIGQTKQTLSKRWKTHCANSRSTKHDEYLYRAMRQHGIENFKLTCIGEYPDDELDARECENIARFNCMVPNGYNMTAGGQGLRNYRPSDATRELQRQKSTGRFPNEEVRKRISEGLKGHPVTAETREKHRINATGVPKRPETIEKLRKAMTGRVVSDETKEKCRLVHLGKAKTPEHIAKIKQVKRGLTDEDIRYIRENPDGLTGVALSEKFNRSKATISRIKNGLRYAD